MLNPADSSFRDPAGNIFLGTDGNLYRSVNKSYLKNYNHLIQSGLYQSLVSKCWLVQHQELLPKTGSENSRVLQPEKIPFVTFPYEWSFSQLKDAALLTLDIQLEALKHDMFLKDASAYNITFYKSKPIFIDTLSFEKCEVWQPWIAYKQFCQHFLAPLALAAYRSPDLIKLLQSHLDGIPLKLAGQLLPFKSFYSLGLLLHVHLHAKAQQRLTKTHASSKKELAVGRQSLLHLTSSLRGTINSLTWQPDKTIWADYYTNTNNYLGSSMQHKEQLVEEFFKSIHSSTVWDIGANTGLFTKIAAKYALQVIATDFDYGATEILYQQVKNEQDHKILPLVSDIVNPSPAIGWFNKERSSLLERIQADTILALAIVHHLAIANNLPLLKIATLFASKCKNLIIEFVPKEDSQVQLLLQNRKDEFSNYTEAAFEEAFTSCFNLIKKEPIQNTSRTLYLLQSI